MFWHNTLNLPQNKKNAPRLSTSKNFFVGKAKKDWKVWGAVCVACVLVSALALRVVFYMTGISIYPFF